jgi:hypothetical protein
VLSRCFELNYANPHNPAKRKERLRAAKEAMERPLFRQAIANCDVSGQAFRIRLMVFLLRHKLYRGMFALVRVNAMTRNLRLKLRKN